MAGASIHSLSKQSHFGLPPNKSQSAWADHFRRSYNPRESFCFVHQQSASRSFSFAINPPLLSEDAATLTSRDHSWWSYSRDNAHEVITMKLRSGTVASAAKEETSSPAPSEPMQPLRRSARIQRSESAKPSRTPQTSRKPKRAASQGNPTPQTTRRRPPTKSSGPRLQQVSTLESQQLPPNTTTRRVTIKITRKNDMEDPGNSLDESSQPLPADTTVGSEIALATSSEQPPQGLEPLESGPVVLDNFQGLSVFQNSSGPGMEEDQQSPSPPSVSMPISNGPDSLSSADVS